MLVPIKPEKDAAVIFLLGVNEIVGAEYAGVGLLVLGVRYSQPLGKIIKKVRLVPGVKSEGSVSVIVKEVSAVKLFFVPTWHADKFAFEIVTPKLVILRIIELLFAASADVKPIDVAFRL